MPLDSPVKTTPLMLDQSPPILQVGPCTPKDFGNAE